MGRTISSSALLEDGDRIIVIDHTFNPCFSCKVEKLDPLAAVLRVLIINYHESERLRVQHSRDEYSETVLSASAENDALQHAEHAPQAWCPK